MIFSLPKKSITLKVIPTLDYIDDYINIYVSFADTKRQEIYFKLSKKFKVILTVVIDRVSFTLVM